METGALLVFLTCVCQCVRCALNEDFLAISKMLPGFYNNKRHDSKSNIHSQDNSVARRDFAMKSSIRPVKVLFLQHAMNVYVEQLYPDHDDRPFKQWLYSFTPDHAKRSIRMRVFNIIKQEDRDKVHRNPRSLKRMPASSLHTRQDCDMNWRRLGDSMFIGATGKGCIGHLRREQVQISISATLTPTYLQMHEGWYKVKDGTKVVEMENPYTLNKEKGIDIKGFFPSRKRRRHRRRSRRRQKSLTHSRRHKAIAAPKNTNSEIKMADYLRDIKSQTKLLTNVISLAGYRQAWSLKDFGGIMDALLSGHKVYYVADMKLCTVNGSSFNNHAFGDYVDVFEYSAEHGDPRDKQVTFSHIKISDNSQESVSWLRELRLYGNNSVLVTLLPMDRYGRRMGPPTTANCVLYDYNTKIGGVKFATDPLRNTHQLKTFRGLRSSLKKGRSVRVTVDLSKCTDGIQSDHVIGGEIRGYDFLDWQGAIEVALERIFVDNILSVEKKCLVGKFTKKEIIMLRTVLYNSNNNSQKTSKRYKCKISHSSNSRAVHLYYH
ncbi:hypothetical protein ScPMuIL_001616 [Solemya velum]